MMIALFFAAGLAAAPQPSTPAPTIAGSVRTEVSAVASENCGGTGDTAEIIVCGGSTGRFRIDPTVMEASRIREAPPPKPELDATKVSAKSGCVGPNACDGGVIPLVRMALVAARAAALAANGEDWREALRTKADEYRLYEERKDRRDRERKVRVEFGARSR
jgi:hypothetical protein